MGDKLITKDDERIVSFFSRLEQVVVRLEKAIGSYQPVLNGERYLTDDDLSKRLKISRRTLQDYRKKGTIPYYQLGGKVLYRESDIRGCWKTATVTAPASLTPPVKKKSLFGGGSVRYPDSTGREPPYRRLPAAFYASVWASLPTPGLHGDPLKLVYPVKPCG